MRAAGSFLGRPGFDKPFDLVHGSVPKRGTGFESQIFAIAIRCNPKAYTRPKGLLIAKYFQLSSRQGGFPEDKGLQVVDRDHVL